MVFDGLEVILGGLRVVFDGLVVILGGLMRFCLTRGGFTLSKMFLGDNYWS